MKVNAKITKIIDKPDSSIKAFASVTLDGYFAVRCARAKRDFSFPCLLPLTQTAAARQSIVIPSIQSPRDPVRL